MKCLKERWNGPKRLSCWPEALNLAELHLHLGLSALELFVGITISLLTCILILFFALVTRLQDECATTGALACLDWRRKMRSANAVAANTRYGLPYPLLECYCWSEA